MGTGGGGRGGGGRWYVWEVEEHGGVGDERCVDAQQVPTRNENRRGAAVDGRRSD